METFYHGTTPSTVIDLKNGKIDVERGGGEFGLGFYVGTSKRLARRRAFHKTSEERGIKIPRTVSAREFMETKNNLLVVQYDESRIKGVLQRACLNRKESLDLFHRVKKKKKTTSKNVLPISYDMIDGHIAGQNGSLLCAKQIKFETEIAQDKLNNQTDSIKLGII